ncbi:MAG: hypothetical protein KAR31_04470 [Candidatus Omnitrophica bacterium]|nr:hypothetical protein [Candidatus Omnitrophota bacterium]
MGKSLFIFNSKGAPKACIIAILMVMITLVGAAFYLMAADLLPAPMLTGQMTFDEKLRYLRENQIRHIEVASIGSSQGLNNLSSDILRNSRIFGENYFNLSVRGVNASDISNYWNALSKIYHPKVLIMCMSPMEFRWGARIGFDESDVVDYTNGKNAFPYYLKYRGIYFLKRIVSVAKYRKRDNSIHSLNFDSAGGVHIDRSQKRFEGEKWDRRFTSIYSTKGYEYFDKMLTRLEKAGIKVIYVVSPMRQYLLEGEEAQGKIEKHWARVKSVLEKHNMVFLNLHEKLDLEDRYFADAIHLYEDGADLFTKKLVEELERRELITFFR